MINNIQTLYKALHSVSVEYLIGINRNNIGKIKALIPQIEQFTTWFLEENQFGIEQELYMGMSGNLLQILEDIVEALEQEDHVLLNDAMSYGLLEYLKLFLEQGDEPDDSL